MRISEENIIAKRPRKTIYRDGDKVAKVFESGYSKSDILNEALNQSRVEETGLKIPRLLEVMRIGDRWAIVSDYIQGKTLQEKMAEEPEKELEYLERFVDIQMSIHRCQSPMLNKIKDKMNGKIEQAELSSDIKYELMTRLEGMPKHKKVCHGDFNPSNVIITEDDEAYVIDWAHVTQGNASADVARTYLLFRLNGEDETAERYLSMFCEKSGTSRKYVQNWMPIVAASQSVKSKAGEREFLMRWANVVQYE